MISTGLYLFCTFPFLSLSGTAEEALLIEFSIHNVPHCLKFTSAAGEQ